MTNAHRCDFNKKKLKGAFSHFSFFKHEHYILRMLILKLELLIPLKPPLFVSMPMGIII